MPLPRPLHLLPSCLAVLAVLCMAAGTWAQTPTEQAVKAAFLVKFGAFVEWPAGVLARPGQPLVIGVNGDEALTVELQQQAAGRLVDTHPLVVRRMTDGASTAGVHILYLAPRREQRLHNAIESTAGPVLVVTSQPDALQAGSVLNFITDAGRVRFAASLASADARNLKLSARLLAVAQSVEGRTR